MPQTVKLIFATLATAGAVASTIVRTEAQPPAPAPAYVVNEIEVTNPAGFAMYAKRQGALIEKFGGRFLARGGSTEAIAGPPAKSRVAIYVFANLAKAEAWHNAPEQTELAALRDGSSKFRSYIVEGCAACEPPTR